jgi:hypothetical protein
MERFGTKTGQINLSLLDGNFDAAVAADQANAAATAANAAALAGKADANAYNRSTHTGTQAATTVLMANGNTLEQEVAAIRALIQPGGASAPVPNAAPAFNAFPGGTADVGETVTWSAGTYTVATPTSVKWNFNINGAIFATVTSATIVLPPEAGQGARAISVTELYTWAGGTDIPGKTSTIATVNVPPAVPVVQTSPTITGTAAVGNTLTLNAGTYNPAVYGSSDAHTFRLYRGGQPSQGGTLIDGPNAQAGTTRNYVVVAADAGASLVLGIVPKNAAGAGVEYFSSPVIVGGAIAPSYTATGAILPGIRSGTFEVGQTITLDFGVPANNATAYSYQVTRDGTDIAGAAGTNIVATSATYLLTTSDQDKTIAFRVTASNAAGTSAPAYAAGIYVAAVSQGGGGVLTFGVEAEIGTTNLTSVGATDWIVPISLTFGSCEQKSGGTQITAIGGSWTVATPSGSTLFNWTNGTPTGTGSATYSCGLRVDNGAAGTVTLGADTTQRTFYLYIEGWNVQGRVNVSLSDASATAQQKDFATGASAYANWAVPIIYKAGAGGQTLTISVTALAGYGGGATVWWDALAIN